MFARLAGAIITNQKKFRQNIVLRKSDSKIEIETEEVNETSANYEANLPNGLSSNIA